MIYIIFACFIVYMEEVLIGYELYNLHQKFLRILILPTGFVNLAQNRKLFFKNYYDGIRKHHSRQCSEKYGYAKFGVFRIRIRIWIRKIVGHPGSKYFF